MGGTVLVAGRELEAPPAPRPNRRAIKRALRRRGAELVHASVGPRLNPLLSESGQRREAYRRAGFDPEREPAVRELVEVGAPPIAGGATGAQGAAFMHNLPPEGEYVMDSDLFFQETERNDVPQQVANFTGLGGGAIDQRVSNVGVLAKIRLVFTGSLVVTTPTGTCTSTYQWPWNLLKRFTLNANGQTSLCSCEGMDLRARRQRYFRNPRDPVSSIGSNAGTTTDGIVDPNPSVIAAGTYPIVLVWDVPIVHDDYTLTGGLFAQSDQIYLSWRFVPAAVSDLFTLTGGATAAVTGSIASTLTFYDIPFYDDPKAGRKVLIPDLQWLHGYLSSDAYFSNTGDVKTPFIRTAGQLLSYSAYLDNGGAAVIDPSALSELRFEYGGNRRPRNYNPPATLLEKNASDYNGRVLPKAGYIVLDFEVDNPRRDLVYPKGVTELLLASVIPSSITLNPNSHVHFVEETLFAGR
jgi:hypothetical protein